MTADAPGDIYPGVAVTRGREHTEVRAGAATYVVPRRSRLLRLRTRLEIPAMDERSIVISRPRLVPAPWRRVRAESEAATLLMRRRWYLGVEITTAGCAAIRGTGLTARSPAH